MKYVKRILFVSICSLISLFQVHSLSVPSNDITLALQSIIVGVATTQGATLLTPKVHFPDASIVKDGALSNLTFTLTQSDIGFLRKQFLSSPPPVVQPKGFFEMLLESFTSIFTNYDYIRMYLLQQHLSEQEIILTGSVSARRIASTLPFRYEGEGSFNVEGNRVQEPFTIEFSYIIPLEGESIGQILPKKVLVNGEDALDIASSIFIDD